MKHIVVSGGSGVVKSTILKRICSARPSIRFCVSWATRSPRPGEDETDYTFVTPQQFRDAANASLFLEWVKISNNAGEVYYGTPRMSCTEEECVLYDVDTQGGLAIQAAYPQETLLIFIAAPEELIRQRLEQREAGRMNPAVLEARMARLQEETACATAHYHHIIVNDDLEECVKNILTIIDNA